MCKSISLFISIIGFIVIIWFLVVTAPAWWKSVIANSVPEKTSITLFPFGNYGPITPINNLLDNGWRLCYTSSDSCGNVTLEFER